MLASSTCSSLWTGTTTSTSGPAGAAAGWASGTRARVRMAAGCSSGGGSMPSMVGPAPWGNLGRAWELAGTASRRRREPAGGPPGSAPPPGDGVDPDGAPVDGHQGGHDRQAEPGAAVGVRAGRVGPVEALEHPLGLPGRQPGAVVDDLDGGPGPAVQGRGAHPDLDRAAGRGVGERVVDQVGQDLAEPPVVAEHDQRGPGRVAVLGAQHELDPAVGGDRPGVVDGVGGQGEQVHRVPVEGRCWSRRASRRRSSTSRPMRAAWSSIRRIRRSSSAGSRDPPCRYSSAKPLMVVRGVRSSWLASATKRRIRSSERLAASSDRRALASEAALAPKAASIWASMVLRARPSRPTSVRGSRSGTRRVRSPAAIALAVCSISTRGRRLARTMTAPTPARASSTTTLTTRSMARSWRMVSSTPSRLAATTTLPEPSRSGCTATRQRPSPPVAGTVTALPALASSQAASSGTRGGCWPSWSSSFSSFFSSRPSVFRYWTR